MRRTAELQGRSFIPSTDALILKSVGFGVGSHSKLRLSLNCIENTFPWHGAMVAKINFITWINR